MYKLCSKCGARKKYEEFCRNKALKNGRNSQCKECRAVYYIKNKSNYQQAYQSNKEALDKYSSQWKRRHPESRRKWYHRVKTLVITKYSGGEPGCICCGEKEFEFLSMDHINNDGAEHRRQMGRPYKGQSIYVWLRKNNYPEGFQVLCMNCNWAKGKLGICPHQVK